MQCWNIPSEPELLIFDIDSTLYTCPEYAHEQIDSQVRHFAEMNGFTYEGARNLIAEYRRKWAADHNGQKISLGNLLKSFGVSIATSIEWRKKLFDPAIYLHRDEKLIKTLSRLKEKFFLICVTNNPVEPARKTLEAIGISEFFPEIIGLDTCMISKPSKKILDAALESAGLYIGKKLEYSQCISIGDRFDIDIDMAVRLGMGGILVSGVEEVWNLDQLLIKSVE